jgi:hypothetical protein
LWPFHDGTPVAKSARMFKHGIRLGAVAMTLAAITACSSKKDIGSAFTTASTTSTKGLKNPHNKPEVVAAIQKVIDACGVKWNDKDGFDGCSDPMKDFRDANGKFDKPQVTYLDILEDEDPRVRWMAVAGLGGTSFEIYSSKELASRVVDAVEKEKPGSILDAHLAYLAGSTYESAGQWDRLHTIALAPTTSMDVKSVLAGWWHGNEKAFDVVKTFGASPDKKLQLAAAQGFALHFEKHQTDACNFWSAHFDDADGDVRKSSVGHLTGGWSGNTTSDTEGSWYVTGGGGGPSRSNDLACSPAQIDAALASIEKRIASNTLDDNNYVYGLESIAIHKKTNAAEKARAVADLKKIVETKGATQRTFALRKLVDIDAKNKTFAAKFATDPDLKWTVESIMKAK